MKSRLPGMLSEQFDKKIREAAESHHPAYDEKAWKGMKRLLDKHMPEEKDDRRRIIFFLLFFLLLGGGAWYFVSLSTHGKTKADLVTTTSPKGTATSTPGDQQKDNRAYPPASVPQKENTIVVDKEPAKDLVPADAKNRDVHPAIKPASKPAVESEVAVTPGSRTRNTAGKKVQGVQSLPSDIAGRAGVTNKDNREVAPGSALSDNQKDDPGKVKDTKVDADTRKTSEPGVPLTVTKQEQPVSADEIAGEKKATTNEVVKKDQETDKEKKEKKTGKKRNSFSLTVSGGPDASFTGADQLGKIRWVGGIGMAYTFQDRFTLRTGFYSARKIYTSSPEEYHGSALFNTYYPNMQKIEADCKVYEIPLGVSYHFQRTEKQNFFASAGLSTYLMKRETYEYYYKYYPTAPTISRKHTTRDKNNHYFSVLGVSAGYQRHFGKRVTVMAEPYFKLPLKGVGEGKVKLNSAGLLFTLSFKPFKQPGKK